MFRAAISIDLPNEPRPFDDVVTRWLARIFLGGDAGKRRIAGEAIALLHEVVAALERAQFSTALSITANGRPAFVDRAGERDDLVSGLHLALEQPQFRSRPVDVEIVAAREGDGLHTVLELALREAVLEGERELELDLSTRVRALRIRADESPRRYLTRVQDALAAGAMQTFAYQAGIAVSRLATELEASTQPIDVRTDLARPRLVVPGPTQIGRLRLLGFGDRCRPPAYSPIRRRSRTGAYDDPQVYYYYDPYHDLLAWVLTGEIAAGRWAPAEFDLLAVDGTRLGSGDGGLTQAQCEVPFDAVSFTDEGIVVDDRVPRVNTLDMAEAGSPYTPGFGGGQDSG